MKILFLGKKKDEYCSKALKFIEKNLPAVDVDICLGKWGEPLPEDIGWWRGDYIISYLSRWVIPDSLIKRAEITAINFHPAPPDYPGVGCINFALYEDVSSYGVTCHHMAPKVDTGDIIAVKQFPVFPSDDLESLLTRTHDYLLVLFYEIMGKIFRGEELPKSGAIWSRKPFTRKELNRLGEIDSTMNPEEIRRRIRATQYGQWKPITKIDEFVFELKNN